MGTAAMTTSLDGFHATATAQRADELARALFDAVNDDDHARIDAILARSFLSYDVHGTRSRTGFKRYVSELHRSFSELRLQVHENIGVLVDGDLVALRTIITGTHTGDYAGVAPTGSPVQTSASHVFRIRDDQFVEHWPVVDTYRILVAIGAIPRAASALSTPAAAQATSRPSTSSASRTDLSPSTGSRSTGFAPTSPSGSCPTASQMRETKPIQQEEAR